MVTIRNEVVPIQRRLYTDGRSELYSDLDTSGILLKATVAVFYLHIQWSRNISMRGSKVEGLSRSDALSTFLDRY